MITEYQRQLVKTIDSGTTVMHVGRGGGKSKLVYHLFLRRMALDVLATGHTDIRIVTSNEARTDSDYGETLSAVRKELEKDIGVIIKNVGFPDYEDLQEFLDDWITVAAECARRGRTLHYRPEETSRKARKAHCEWVAKISGEKVGRIRRLLGKQARFAGGRR